MTQKMNSPLFRNCPYAEIYETELFCDCRNCKRYESCVKKKAIAKRNKKAKERELKRRWRKKRRGNHMPVPTVLLVAILSIMFCTFIANGISNNAVAAGPNTISVQSEEPEVCTSEETEASTNEFVATEDQKPVIEEVVEEATETEVNEETQETESTKITEKTEAVQTAEETDETEVTQISEEADGTAKHAEQEEIETIEVSEINQEEEASIEAYAEIESQQVEEVAEVIADESGQPRISAYEPGTSYYYELTAEDKKDIEKLLYREARGECYKGKVAVAAVVLNRYYSDNPGFNHDSIHGVITQSGAFASISNVTQSMLDTVPDLAEAVEDACRGWDPTREVFEKGALFFYAPTEVRGYQKEVRDGITVMQIGGHNFHFDFNK